MRPAAERMLGILSPFEAAGSLDGGQDAGGGILDGGRNDLGLKLDRLPRRG